MKKILLSITVIIMVAAHAFSTFAANIEGHQLTLKKENPKGFDIIKSNSISEKICGAKKDLATKMMPIGDQGIQGSCASWATGYYYRGFQKQTKLSPAFLFNQVNLNGEGSYLSDNFNLMVDQGICTWAYMPYDQFNYTKQPTPLAKVSALQYRISQWGVIGDTNGNVYKNNPDSIKAWLNTGDPVVIGIPVDSDFWVNVNKIKYSAKKTAGSLTGCKTQLRLKNKTGEILSQNKTYETRENKVYLKVFKGSKIKSIIKSLKEGKNTFKVKLVIGKKSATFTFIVYRTQNTTYDVFKKSLGGHALCVCGYDDEKKAFKVINSWGKGWGYSGYGWVSYSLIQSGFAGSWDQVGYVMVD